MLGRRDIQTTRRYTHLEKSAVDNIMQDALGRNKTAE
jgi:site-specific recombinase XerD